MSTAVRRQLSRFGVKLYVMSLLQFALIIAALIGAMMWRRPAVSFAEELRAVQEGIEQRGTRAPDVAAEATRLERQFGWTIAVLDPAGAQIGGSLPAPELQRREGAAPRPPPTRGGPRFFPLAMDDTRGPWWLVVTPPPPPPLSDGLLMMALMASVITALGSWLLARTLSTPLRRLQEAAHALGRGELTTRSGLRRSDELGEVSAAFDAMAERLSHALRTERELLANVSHELRTPMQRIKIAVELAAEGDAGTVRESLTDIAEDLQELERLVEDVLAAARPPEGAPFDTRLPLRAESCSLGEVAERAAMKFRQAHPERELRLSLPEAPPRVEADSMLLRRAVDNLLQNAHRYSEPHEPIELRVRGSEPGWSIEVQDRGIGLSAEDAARVFEPFFRADRSRTRATGGLGLGLTLAQRIVEAHGGAIALDSEMGRGTTVRITWPAA